MDNKDLKYIKKHYGEKMAHLCRAYFPTVLEQEGLLSNILDATFDHTRYLAEDLEYSNKLSEMNKRYCD